jgi:long-chain fatty acid transport protein
MYRFLGICVLGAVLGLAASVPVSAQGFGVYEQGACMTGRGGAGVADPCHDGSGIFFNPASLVNDGKVMTFGSVLIGPTGTFTDTSNTAMNGTVSTLENHWYPVPNIYLGMPLGNRSAFGVGVMAPFGLTTQWPVESQGRYLGYKSLVQGLYVQPTYAVKLTNSLSVGVGVDVTYLNVGLRQRAELSTQPLGTTGLTFGQLNLVCPASVCGTVPFGTDFADIQLKGDTWHAGYHLGVQYKSGETFAFGMRYMGGQKIDVNDGTIATDQIPVPGVKIPAGGGVFVPVDTALASQFAAGGKLSDQTATTSIPMPAQFVAGVMFQVAPTVKLFADYQWTNWSKFDVLPINGQYLTSSIVESYRDVSGFRMGTEIALGQRSELRAGFNVHGAAAPDQSVTPNLPEGSRREFMVGYGARVTRNLVLDLSYMYLGQPDRAGRTYAGTTAADNNGIYSFNANLLGASLSIHF